MYRKLSILCILIVFMCNSCDSQVLQFGKCQDVKTMKYFDLERFLGKWYEISRFPTWYEDYGLCAYKTIQYCGRRIEIEHVFVRDGIQFVLHVNSTYYPGDEAVFAIQENNIDPIGIPLKVISTDYSNYALIYGCRTRDDIGIKYISAWVLSRKPTLTEDIYQRAVKELNTVPNANVAFLETVQQNQDRCSHYWTAHVNAVYTSTEENLLI